MSEGPRPYTSFVLCSWTICIWPYSHWGLWSNHHHRHHWLCMNYMIAMLFLFSCMSTRSQFLYFARFLCRVNPQNHKQKHTRKNFALSFLTIFFLLAMSWRCFEWFSFFFQRKAFLGSRILHLTGYQRKGTTATGDPRLKCYGCN